MKVNEAPQCGLICGRSETNRKELIASDCPKQIRHSNLDAKKNKP